MFSDKVGHGFWDFFVLTVDHQGVFYNLGSEADTSCSIQGVFCKLVVVDLVRATDRFPNRYKKLGHLIVKRRVYFK